MGRWRCKCGQLMSDRVYPSPNQFIVFSTVCWDEIMSKVDENDKIHTDYFWDKEDNLEMWKCPNCGSFMIWGEDSNSDRYTFYRSDFFENKKDNQEE